MLIYSNSKSTQKSVKNEKVLIYSISKSIKKQQNSEQKTKHFDFYQCSEPTIFFIVTKKHKNMSSCI